MRTSFLAPVLLTIAACDCDDCDDDPPGPPLFQEAEPNNGPGFSNNFGIIEIGDHFLIQGFVRDDDADPNDRFTFRSATPLHVDFQLFIDTDLVDLDVCLFDPALDPNNPLACFATQNNPEQGGVDVTLADFFFQLEVSSFMGDGPYTLELVVQPLFLGASAEDAAGVPGAAVSAVGARMEHEPASMRRQREKSRGPLVEVEQRFEIDRESGDVLAIVHVRR